MHRLGMGMAGLKAERTGSDNERARQESRREHVKAGLVPDRTETNRAKLVEALHLMMEGLWQVEPEGL